MDAIGSREDFVSFVLALAGELREEPKAWENSDLPSFLDGLARWVADMDGYYKNVKPPPTEEPNWKLLADMLMAATMYE